MVGPPFGTVTREAVPQQIVSRLLDLIQQRHLGPGDRLPAERELAATMGVSRSSLREALRALTVLGVTEMRHGTGTYVSSLEPDLLVRPLSFVLSLSDGGFDQLFEARKVVEPAIAALAAARVDDATVDRLDALVTRAEAVIENSEAFMVTDVELHDDHRRGGRQRDPRALHGVDPRARPRLAARDRHQAVGARAEREGPPGDRRCAAGARRGGRGRRDAHPSRERGEGAAVTRIVDLTLQIGEDTLSPPSVNKRLELTTHHRGPGFWQASEVNMLLHTGSHVDFGRHCAEDGETAADVSLDRTCGEAIVIDLTFLGEDEPITVALLEEHAPRFEDGDVALCRTDWTEKAWGRFPDYYMRSPYCEPEAAGWLVDQGAKVVGFDCFSERSAREPDFTSEDFVVHKAILDRGAILIQQLTGLSQLPVGVRVPFFAGFVPIRGAEGSPGRMFALVD